MSIAANGVLRPGIINQPTGTDPAAMLLTVFAGEVLAQFEEMNIAMARTRVKTVSGGAKSYQFPVIGLAGTKYHVPGEDILTDSGYLQTIKGGQRLIHADRVLTSSVFLDKLDQILNHWDARSEYAQQLGRAIAKTVDQNILRVLYEAAHVASDALFTGSLGGNHIVDADGDTNGASFVDAVFKLAVLFDEKDVPKENRYLAVSPAQMRLLFTSGAGAIQTLEWVDSDYNGGNNGSGFAGGRVARLAGFELVVTNHIDQGAGTFGTTDNQYSSSVANDYQITVGAGEDILALGWQEQAVGTVKIADLSLESEYMIRYQGDVLVAKMIAGHGILRPECAGVIQKA